EVMSERSLLRQNGHVIGSKVHCATHRPQIKRRSAAGVITESSGSHPQYGQCPDVGDGGSPCCIRTSAHRARNGRRASTSTWSKPSGVGGDPAAVLSCPFVFDVASYQAITVGSSWLPKRPRATMFW